ncbi:MAG: tRNA epoxyqueuosine(34) reductase QueG [Aquisalinus sp.]|nr:tRNA epoxyqueuosine(34) reductase QueG [Aquisalinus sp.]
MRVTEARKEDIRKKAHAEGFDAVGFASATLPSEVAQRLSTWLAAGHHGSMIWMEDRQSQRISPDALWPGAKSVIMLGLNYGPDGSPLRKLSLKDQANISVYAQNKDYHDIIKKRLKRIGRWLCDTHGCNVKVFVDTAPVMEKPLAANAGIGWQGKHTNLVSREYGSWLFLGAIFTTAELLEDLPEEDHCGSCTSCLDICPTDAFPGPYQLDARRCISYLTIEHKGHIPIEYRKAIGNRIYGCDDCLAVCPWNKFAQQTDEISFHTRETLKAPLLAELAGLDDTAFRELFRASPIKRIGRDRFVRNVMIAIGNSENPDLMSYAEELLEDHSELVREAAHWAAGELRAISKEA